MSKRNAPESSNGISLDVIDSWKTSLAELAEQAPNNKIRDCIRTYDPEKPTIQNVKALKACLKDTIMETLMFLSKIPIANNINKDEAVSKLCLKIKNFFQDICQICNESYTIKLDHQPLLSCGSCGQEVHRQCYGNLFKSMNLLNDKKELSYLIFNIPGIHYLCPSCQEEAINFPRPITHNNDDTDNSTPSKLQTPVSQTKDIEHQSKQTPRRTLPHIPISPDVILHQDLIQESNIYLGRTAFMKNKFQRDLQNSIALTSDSTTEGTTKESISSSDNQEVTTTVCHFYKKGKCKHGIRGKKCHYNHPKACTKLMRHGNKGPKGCNNGTKCLDFSSSIRNNECFNETCTFVHVKGTKRRPPPMKSTSKSRNLQESDFLKLLDNFRTEMMTAIQENLKRAHQPNPQTFPQKYQPQMIPHPQNQQRNLHFYQGNHWNQGNHILTQHPRITQQQQ